MLARKTADDWFAEYSESHQHPANRRIHAICAPLVFGCLLGFVWMIPVPEAWQEAVPWFSWSLVAMGVGLFFYFLLSPALSAGVLFMMAVCYGGIVAVEIGVPWSVGRVSAVLFVVTWTGLFIGRLLERTPPAFGRDLVFLFIGPAWLVSRVYRRLGQKY